VLTRSGEFAMLPFFQQAHSHTLTQVAIGPDGSSRLTVTRSGSGALAEPYRRVPGGDVARSLRSASNGFLQLPGPARLATTYDLKGSLGDAVFAFAKEPMRHQDFVCPAIDAEDELRFYLPTRSRVLALPRAVYVDDANFAYHSRYARRGALVTVQRQLKFRHTAATCTPDDYRRMRPALERMLRDLRSQVVFKRG
jgi:hypothetical protein